MAKNENDDIKVKQINPSRELNDLEKTAILQFKIDSNEEKLSKTMQFKALNMRETENNLDLPKLIDDDEIILPKKKDNLSNTIRIKLSDLRNEIDKEKEIKKKSLYDTIVIKLDDLINSREALKVNANANKKITDVEKINYKKKFHLFSPKDITKDSNFKLNVDSEEFGRQLYNLNRIALNNLSLYRNKESNIRSNPTLFKLRSTSNISLSRRNYLKFQKEISKFAINKLYYKFAPKESKKYKLYKACVTLSGIIFVVTSGIIVNWFVEGISTNNLSYSLSDTTEVVKVVDNSNDDLYNFETQDDDTKNSLYWKYLNTPFSSIEFESLVEENDDTVGWLIVNNTNVNYPVVQTTNNSYYLTHSFDKKTNGAGWVFADFRDNFDEFTQNTVIYAHGRKDKVMFGSLTNALDSDWYTNSDNQIIQFSTLKYNTMWQIFAVYKIKAESYYISTDFVNESDYDTFLKTMKARSIYDFGIDLTTNDKILTLSTCYNDNGIRLVIQAKLVKIQAR